MRELRSKSTHERVADYTAEAYHFPEDATEPAFVTSRARFDNLEDAQQEATQYVAATERTKVFIFCWPYGQQKLHSVIK